MLHNLKIEWLKIKNYRTFWVLLICFLVCCIGFNIIPYQIKQELYKDDSIKAGGNMILGDPYSFPRLWQSFSFFSSFMLLLPSIFIINSVANEYIFKTHRQNVIDGWDRKQFVTTKIALVVCFSIVCTLFNILGATIFGAFTSIDFSHYFSGWKIIGFFFVQCLSYFSLAMFFGFLFKKPGMAIGLFFAYHFVVESILGGLLAFAFKDRMAANFFPVQSADSLIPIMDRANEISGYNPQIFLPLAIFYILLFWLGSYLLYMKKDL